MGNKKRSNKIPALIWIKIAGVDLKRAERALINRDFPDCVYRSQQATEKSIKSLLELSEIIVRDHFVAERLKNLIESRDKIIHHYFGIEKILSGVEK
ncbi:MAG: HEPN domain-containing protein [Candidatus Aenigmatarchaeota archaeon]